MLCLPRTLELDRGASVIRQEACLGGRESGGGGGSAPSSSLTSSTSQKPVSAFTKGPSHYTSTITAYSTPFPYATQPGGQGPCCCVQHRVTQPSKAG